MKFAFKTPTLRSVALRPPYMHNGSATTLYEVVKHYETGGIDRPSRSAAIAKLDLSEQDRLDLVAFMQTLTGVAEGDTPPKLP
jgi:cytochrome c peroxidase